MLKKEREGKASRIPGERGVAWRARVQAACCSFGCAMEQVRKEKGNYGWHFTSGVPCDVCGAQGRCHIREDGSEVCMECIEKEQAELVLTDG